MNYSKMLARILLMLTVVGITFGLFTHSKAQKKEEIVEYLEQRFEVQNIPVTDIQILEVYPLNLQIIIQSVGDFITPEDSINLHKVDREVFIIAYQRGYNVERYTRILQDSKGNQLYKLDQGATDVQQAIVNTNTLSISDDDVKKVVSERVTSLTGVKNLQNIAITIDVSSVDGIQTLNMQFSTQSLDEAYSAFGFLNDQLIYPLDPLITDVNSQGGQVVVCTYEIKDEKGNLLFFYFYDYQLQRGTWSAADSFQVDLGEGPPQ